MKRPTARPERILSRLRKCTNDEELEKLRADLVPIFLSHFNYLKNQQSYSDLRYIPSLRALESRIQESGLTFEDIGIDADEFKLLITNSHILLGYFYIQFAAMSWDKLYQRLREREEYIRSAGNLLAEVGVTFSDLGLSPASYSISEESLAKFYQNELDDTTMTKIMKAGKSGPILDMLRLAIKAT